MYSYRFALMSKLAAALKSFAVAIGVLTRKVYKHSPCQFFGYRLTSEALLLPSYSESPFTTFVCTRSAHRLAEGN